MTSATDLVALVCCDLGSIVRGRSLPASALAAALDRGVGWVPADLSLTPLGPLAEPNPFGCTGDLRLLPDTDTLVRLESHPPDGDGGDTALEFVLCDLVETDGRPWECCPRRFLRDALGELESELGVRAVTSFEHEFQLMLGPPVPPPFSLHAQRRAEPLPAQLMAALHQAGVQPELFLPEFAAHQFEVPVAPAEGIAGADRSVVLKEVVYEVARRNAVRASFAPLLDPTGPGSGLHIHISLLDADGRPALYDAGAPACLSELGQRFAAGILQHAAALIALTAPSPPSAARLAPHHWSAGAVCLAERNREALLRIPPLVTLAGAEEAGQLRLEYRGADATANPYLALGGIVRAGLDGVRSRLPAPPLLECDPASLDAEAATRYGVGALPDSLEGALLALAEDRTARSWMSPMLYEAYVSVKRAELQAVAALDLDETCERYAAVY